MGHPAPGKGSPLLGKVKIPTLSQKTREGWGNRYPQGLSTTRKMTLLRNTL